MQACAFMIKDGKWGIFWLSIPTGLQDCHRTDEYKYMEDAPH
jgi:hypothetical protein